MVVLEYPWKTGSRIPIDTKVIDAAITGVK